ncbi:MAG TPA: nuclear pore complex subunit [Flavobacteriales bacterium]|nr:nuclear pore complex subunit [Flavobacteriales bacterium]
MENLHIAAEKKSPSVDFELYSGLLRIGGNSSLENPGKFYDNLINWLESYTLKPAVKTTFKMEMEYFNSSSSKHLMRALRIMERIQQSGKSDVLVEWYHNEHDGSMFEAGEDFASMLKVPFTYIEVKD